MSRSANHYFTGAGPSGPANYIEDVFSTFLYTGDSAVGGTERVSGVPMSGVTLNPGMIWVKNRSSAANHYIYSSPPGSSVYRSTNTTAGNLSSATGIYNFQQIEASSNGFYTFGDDIKTNQSGQNYVSWTFKEQSKFFDVVTYNGDSTAGKTVAHNLGSVPGTIIVKITSGAGSWFVYHRSLGATKYLLLDDSGTGGTSSGIWNNTAPTSSVFTLGNDGSVNSSGQTYIAYLFAHDAGGFGLTGNDNVISCGSFTTDGTGAAGNITLGYEAQWILLKRSDGAGSWNIIDTMRGSSRNSYNYLQPNASTAESSSTSANQGIFPTETGFFVGTNFPAASATYIYIAIRRGPMKVPTVGTSVFSATIATTNIQASTQLPSAGFPVDLHIGDWRNGSYGAYATDRLRGGRYNLLFSNGVESSSLFAFDSMTNVRGTGNFESSSNPFVFWQFRRAPGFFDEICYTGTGTIGQVVNHNLGVVPELVICVCRLISPSYSQDHNYVYAASRGINATLATNSSTYNGTSIGMFSAAPTATQLTLRNVGGDGLSINYTDGTYVSYLFATAPGVSKVGSYTGTGTTLQVNCGFTTGARFILIKRTDSTGAWYVWDTARGIIAGNDPYLLLNSTATEVTNTDYIDPYSPGFELSSTAPADLNANGGTYIFLAIA